MDAISVEKCPGCRKSFLDSYLQETKVRSVDGYEKAPGTLDGKVYGYCYTCTMEERFDSWTKFQLLASKIINSKGVLP
jgi:hypothetical protein